MRALLNVPGRQQGLPLPQKTPTTAVLFTSSHTSIFFLESYQEQALFKRAYKPTPNRKLLTSAAQDWRAHRTVLEMFFRLQTFPLDCPNFIGSLLCCVLDPPAVCSSASAYPLCLRTILLCLIEFLLCRALLLVKRSLLPDEHPGYVKHQGGCHLGFIIIFCCTDRVFYTHIFQYVCILITVTYLGEICHLFNTHLLSVSSWQISPIFIKPCLIFPPLEVF